MPDSKVIRFGVRAISGARAATWRVWNPGGSAADVYIACRALQGEMKASLHASGRWHVSLSQKLFDASRDNLQNPPPNRFPVSWSRPKELSPGFTLAYRIVVPWYSVTTPSEPETEDVVWMPPAPEGSVTEFLVMITSKTCPPGEWPGCRSMGTQFVGSFELMRGDTVWVVATVGPFQGAPSLAATPSYYIGRGPPPASTVGLRFIAFVEEPDGSRTMYDLPGAGTPRPN